MFAFAIPATLLSQISNKRPTEYEAKAAYIFNFGLFIDWPTAKYANAKAPFIIGILGEDPFREDLEKTIRGETVEGRQVLVQRFSSPSEARRAHVLFISNSEKRRLNEIFSTLKGAHVLTVGEMEGFCEEGGMVQFAKEGNRIILGCINIREVREAQLEVDSALLDVFKQKIMPSRKQ